MEKQLLEILSKWQRQSEAMAEQGCGLAQDLHTVNQARRLVAKATQLNECIADLQKLMMKEVKA